MLGPISTRYSMIVPAWLATDSSNRNRLELAEDLLLSSSFLAELLVSFRAAPRNRTRNRAFAPGAAELAFTTEDPSWRSSVDHLASSEFGFLAATSLVINRVGLGCFM